MDQRGGGQIVGAVLKQVTPIDHLAGKKLGGKPECA
jgi:hypothetical protein